MNLKDISWIEKEENISINAQKTPNRLDDSIRIRAKMIKPINQQGNKDMKVDISDSVFNNMPGFGPGTILPYNKARMKLYGSKLLKINNIIGKRKGLNHI